LTVAKKISACLLTGVGNYDYPVVATRAIFRVITAIVFVEFVFNRAFALIFFSTNNAVPGVLDSAWCGPDSVQQFSANAGVKIVEAKSIIKAKRIQTFALVKASVI